MMFWPAQPGPIETEWQTTVAFWLITLGALLIFRVPGRQGEDRKPKQERYDGKA
jgi:hypothetical protein